MGNIEKFGRLSNSNTLKLILRVIIERLHVDVVTVYRNLNTRGEAEGFKFNKIRGEAEFFI